MLKQIRKCIRSTKAFITLGYVPTHSRIAVGLSVKPIK